MPTDEPGTVQSDRDLSRATPTPRVTRGATAVLVGGSIEPVSSVARAPDQTPAQTASPGTGSATTPAPPEVLDSTADPASESRDPLVGATIADRYKLIERVGEGGMGAVYRGEHITLRKRVAVKFLHAELSRIPDVVARFEREAVAAANLEHVNVVAAHDFGKTRDGQFFLVMEFVDGGSLRDLLQSEVRLAPSRGLHIGRHIAAALNRAHSLGIVHRDLKPENVVLVEREGDKDFAKVIDFGIAKVSAGKLGGGGASLTQAGMVFGTPDYMAPEQALGGNVDHRADLYAFGVMMFEMLTGRRPFEAEDVMGILGQHMTATPPSASATAPPGALNPAVDAVLSRMLAKSPGERFPSAIGAIQSLEAALGITLSGHYGTPPMGITAPAPQAIATGPYSAQPAGPSLQFGTAQSIPGLTSGIAPAVVAPTGIDTASGAGPTGSQHAMSGSQGVGPARSTRALTTLITGYRELRHDRARHRLVVYGVSTMAALALAAGFAVRPRAPSPTSWRQSPGPVLPRTAAHVPPREPGRQPEPAPPPQPTPTAALTPGTGAVTASSGLPAAVAARLAEYRARPDVAAALADLRGRRLRTAVAAFEQARAQAPDDPIVAYTLGTLYAQSSGGLATAAERYADAVRAEPGFARDATLLRDVVRAYLSARRPPPAATALLAGPLAPHAGPAVVEEALEGRAGATRGRAAALLQSPQYRGQMDATVEGIFALANAGSCEARRPVVQQLGRVGDARALPYLRRIRVGAGCGFFGLGQCNPCLTSTLPEAISAIERRAR